MPGDSLHFDATAFNGIRWERGFASQSIGALLPVLACIWRAKTIIEIGIADGFTTQCAAAALAATCPGEGLLISVDINEGARAQAEAASAGYDVRHEILIADSNALDWAEVLRAMGREEAGLVIVDGDHRYEGVSHDLRAVAEVLRRDGLLLAHDAWQTEPGVVRAIDEMIEAGWQRVWLPPVPDLVYPAAILQRPGHLWEH